MKLEIEDGDTCRECEELLKESDVTFYIAISEKEIIRVLCKYCNRKMQIEDIKNKMQEDSNFMDPIGFE